MRKINFINKPMLLSSFSVAFLFLLTPSFSAATSCWDALAEGSSTVLDDSSIEIRDNILEVLSDKTLGQQARYAFWVATGLGHEADQTKAHLNTFSKDQTFTRDARLAFLIAASLHPNEVDLVRSRIIEAMSMTASYLVEQRLAFYIAAGVGKDPLHIIQKRNNEAYHFNQNPFVSIDANIVYLVAASLQEVSPQSAIEKVQRLHKSEGTFGGLPHSAFLLAAILSGN